MEPSIDPELGKKLLEDYIFNKKVESAPWQNPEFARRELEDYLKYKNPYISTFSLRMSFDSLNDKKDIKLAEKFMFHDDWNLILGSTDAMKRLGVSVEKIFDIYKAKLKDPKKRNISILALERLGYVPGNEEERLAFYIKHNKFDSVHREMPQKINILFKLLIKEKDTFILEKGIEIIGRYYAPKDYTKLLNLFKKNPHPNIAELLCQQGEKKFLPYLIEIIEKTGKNEQQNYFTSRYIKILGEYKDDSSIELLLNFAINHNQDEIHKTAVNALACIGNPKVIPLLLKSYISQKDKLGNYSFPIRDSISLYGQGAIPYLVNELENENSEIRNLVINNLKKLSWKPVNNDEKELFEGKLIKKTALLFLESNNVESCLMAMDYFITQNDKSANSKIVPLLKSNNKIIQKRAYSVLKAFNWNPSELNDKIHFSIFDEDWKSLIEIGQPSVRQLLIEMKRVKSENIWDSKIKQIMDTITEIPDLTESNFDLMRILVDDGYFQDFALSEIEKKGNISIDLLIELLNYNGYNESEVQDKVVNSLIKINSKKTRIALVKAIPNLDKKIIEKIVDYLLVEKKESYEKDFLTALENSINKLFVKLSQGYDYSLILKKMGADENKIVDTCMNLLKKLERPSGYEGILNFFILIKSAHVIKTIFDLIKIPKPGAENFYKDLVNTIGEIGNQSALPFLYDLLNTKWKIIGERNGTRITDSKWIEPNIKLAIDKIKNSKGTKNNEIKVIYKFSIKNNIWSFWK